MLNPQASFALGAARCFLLPGFRPLPVGENRHCGRFQMQTMLISFRNKEMFENSDCPSKKEDTL